MKKLNMTTSGFTIIELLIATLIVSTLLLLCVYGLAQVSRFFTKGVTSASTQDTSRNVLEDITSRIQVEQNQVLYDPNPASPSPKVYCIGLARYTYSFNNGDLTDGSVLGPNDRMLTRDELPSIPNNFDSCKNNPSGTNKINLLKDNMRVVDLTISQPPASNGRLYNVSFKVLYAPDDAALAKIVEDIDPDPAVEDVRCSGARGAEFCGMSSLSTTVFRFNECTYCVGGP